MKDLMTDDTPLYSQRNNEILPPEACNVTAMCQALAICGYQFPKGDYRQEEDNLMYFILHDPRVRDFYVKYNQPSYKPYELHEALCYATNLWMDKHVCAFRASIDFEKTISNIDHGNCILFGGRYPTYKGTLIDHITCCHGYAGDNIILADSWGNYQTLYAETRAQRSVLMPHEDFISYIKTPEVDVKWGDIVYARS